MRILRAHEHAVVPWKNGGGVTREVALLKHGEEQDFAWRLSIATVDRDGPFSCFEGIDRTIAVLDGTGMVLEDPNGRHRVVQGGDPYSFPGETPISATLIRGTTTDLNMMTRRGRYTHSMERLAFHQSVTIEAEADETILLFNSHATAGSGADRYAVHPCDAARDIAPGAAIALSAEGGAELFVIRLSRIAR